MRGEAIKRVFKDRLEALGESAEVLRLRLALIGAKASAFDWTIRDDQIHWDGGAVALRHHPELESLTCGGALQAWLGPHARGRLLGLIEEVSPADPAFTMEFEATRKALREWFEISGVRTPGPDGRAERVTGVVREITQQKQAFTRLSYLATRDELTGHLNRTRLREELSRVILRATGEGRPCAFVVAAIDDLAVINETYGFDVADEVIVATGQRLMQALRDLRRDRPYGWQQIRSDPVRMWRARDGRCFRAAPCCRAR